MNYKLIIFILLSLTLFSCKQTVNYKVDKKSLEFADKYSNSGFALIYNDNLKDIKSLENRSLNIYHKSLKKRSLVKITNPKNGRYLLTEVKSNRVKFSNFYNSVLSLRIAEELELDFNEPFVELILVPKDSTFVAKKAKMFEEEKTVAEKKIKNNKSFSYSIKVADFYYKDTAQMMINRIKTEAFIKNLKIIKISETKYRVLIGPFNDIKSLKGSFEKMNKLNFENLEIINNV